MILWAKLGYLWLLFRLKCLEFAVICVLLSVSLEDSLPAEDRQKMVLPPRSCLCFPLLFCRVTWWKDQLWQALDSWEFSHNLGISWSGNYLVSYYLSLTQMCHHRGEMLTCKMLSRRQGSFSNQWCTVGLKEQAQWYTSVASGVPWC